MTWGTCTQALFFPPIYMMERFSNCNNVIIMDEAQYSRKAYHSWCVVKSRNGDMRISIPLKNKSNRALLNELYVFEINNFLDKFWIQMEQVYGKQPGYKELKGHFADLIHYFWDKDLTLTDLNSMTMGWCMRHCNILPNVFHSLDLIERRPDNACYWLSSLSDLTGVTDYIQGKVSIENYFVSGMFSKYDIRVWGQEFKVPEYEQLSKPFNPEVSILDPLFKIGPEKTMKLLFDKKEISYVRMKDYD